MSSEQIYIDVEVIVDGTWWPGTLERWRKDGDRWTGYVRWNVGVGMNHIGWLDQDDVRKTIQKGVDLS